jgi:hypothetical protein
MSTLATPLRRQLENVIKQARKIAEAGARHALEALAVHEPAPYQHMDEAQGTLWRQLRAQAKQLGDSESRSKPGAYEIKHLTEKLAYDQWHRLLFARYLLENDLLISPEHGVSVSLDDCEELNSSLGLKDAWAVAARFAAKELPEIFRADDPAGAAELSVNDRKPLIELVTGLPLDVFTASDSLGWCYQFWQAEKKDEVNAAGCKIGAEELPAVTQLFTEDYMVEFLLDNTLGAWHAGKVLTINPALAETAQSEDDLRNVVALPGCSWKYLRFIKAEDGKWSPAAGTFNGWPKTAQELKCLDPCMGSGHFVVEMFERMVALRIAEEMLDEGGAVAAVIESNLFGMEIDPRCTQIAAFNLALAAWKRVGHCTLPAMNLACSGLAPNTRESDWLAMAGDNEKLNNGMARLYRLFKDAPVLGSLINPRRSADNMFVADYHELQPLLEKALAQETRDDTAQELAVTARGLAKAAEILAGQFTLVATNVPYLKAENQGLELKEFIEENFNGAKADLATAFVQRWFSTRLQNTCLAVVLPQNWLSQPRYLKFRDALIEAKRISFIARLGPRAFQSISGEVVNVLLGVFAPLQTGTHARGLDTTSEKTPDSKKAKLLCGSWSELQLRDSKGGTRDNRISFSVSDGEDALVSMGLTFKGITSNDDPSFLRGFWELDRCRASWEFHLTAVEGSALYGGRSNLILFESGSGRMRELSASQAQDRKRDLQGNQAWGKCGIAISLMGSFPVTPYSGEKFDTNVAVFLPTDTARIPALFAYFADPEFATDLKSVDGGLKLTNSSIKAVSFNLAHWQKVAAEKYSDGLPKPFSSDPTQWLFNGHPAGSDQPLHVAVARLIGYQWPRQTDSSFHDCPALDPDGLEVLADVDGIVCLSATKGEAPAAERLRGLLVQALGNFDLSALLASASPKGSKSETLEEWLRDEFFEQHCALFNNRPFIWHVWDGHKSGFSALVNYHKLNHANLEKLTYAYLGDWIRRQQASVETGEAGSDARLQAAKVLQTRLKFILEGEPPYDIFVRWKPLSQQAIGWLPDINDGVRMNIRPFLVQDIPGGKKGAGILRTKPNIKWEKDRGKEPVRDKAEFPWFWGWDGVTQDFPGLGKEPDGNRWNGCHYSNAVKQAARISRK